MDASSMAQFVRQANPSHVRMRLDEELLEITAKVLRLYCQEKFLRRA